MVTRIQSRSIAGVSRRSGVCPIISQKYHVGRTTIHKWVTAYRIHGIGAFSTKVGNASYTKEFKTMCVEAVISGLGSSVEIGARYNVYPAVLESWIKMYNANRELKDYDPKREVYMAEARRKTTLEERKEIVEYCIVHGRDYKGTASKYDVSYSQVYSWVKSMMKMARKHLLTSEVTIRQMKRWMNWNVSVVKTCV